MNDKQQGTVVTFYSFKGGTGRTMALANVAWILASAGKRVLAADWDLESPGLHRFLHPFLDESGVSTTRGIIGMIHDYALATMRKQNEEEGEDGELKELPEGWHRDYARVIPVVIPINWQFPQGGSLDFLPAGSHNRDFAAMLLSLSWDNFFDRLGGKVYFDALRADMKANYDYVLIDSRTGLSDVADICTIHLPDVLVDCFTLSEQGISGAAERAQEIEHYYLNRGIRILPVPMRVDDFEKRKADAGRASARKRFANLPSGMETLERLRYWGDVEIPYRPFYAYEETLAVFGDAPGRATSLLSALERLTARITENDVIELTPIGEQERLATLERFVRPPELNDVQYVVGYVPADVMWGEWITQVLQEAGFAASAADLSESAGTPHPEARLIAVMSRSFAATQNAVDYAKSVQEGARESEILRFIGVQVRGAPAEQPFSTAPATALADHSEREAITALLRAVGFSGSSRIVDPAKLTARYPGRTPRVWNAPTRNTNFTGRSKDLGRLYSQLRSDGGAGIAPVVLHGIGGVGKTQLALEYVHRFQADYDLVWWVDADQTQFVDANLIRMAEHFDLPVHSDSSKLLDSVLSALRQGERYPRSLIVFDNADDPETIKRFLPNGPRNRVLITSRNPNWAGVAEPLAVDVFDRAESVEHLARRVPGIERKDADRVAETLGDMPLAVAGAGALMSETGTSATAFLEQYDGSMAALARLSTPEYPTSVAVIWDLALKRLEARSKAALRLYQICSVLASEISMDLITGDVMATLLTPLEPSLELVHQRRTLIRELQRLALIKLDSDRDSIHVHRIGQSVVRDSMTPEERDRSYREAHLVLAAARPSAEEAIDSPTHWPTYDQLWAHLEPSRLFETDVPKAWELLVDRIRYLWLRGDLPSGLRFGERIDHEWVGKLERMAADDPHKPALSRWLLHLRFNLANTLRQAGEFHRAKQLDTQVLAEQRELLGEHDTHTLMTAGSLAADLRAAGDYGSALELDEETFAGFQEIFGERHRRTLAISNNLAEDLRRLGDYAQARDRDLSVLRDRRSLLGPNDPYTLHSAAFLGRDLRETGEYEQSVARLEETFAAYRATLGDEAPDTLSVKVSLAVSLRASGETERAHTLTDEALRVYASRHSETNPSNPDLLACQINQAADQFALNRRDQAARQIAEAVDTLAESIGPDHPYTLACINNRATYLRGRDPDAALASARRAFDGLAATLGADHPHTLAAQMTLANCLADHQRYDEAQALEENAASRLTNRLGADHPDTLRCQANLAISRQQNRPGDPEAQPAFNRALAALVNRLGKDHPTVKGLREKKRADRLLEPQVI